MKRAAPVSGIALLYFYADKWASASPSDLLRCMQICLKDDIMVKKRGLGKSLDALLGSNSIVESMEEPTHKDKLSLLPIHLIEQGRYQPRREMDPDALQDLANSIRAQGVIQPIVVRHLLGGRYEIVAGERRFRAAKELGLKEPGLNRLIRSGYHLLHLITYFTAGPKEVRAWTIHQGTKAPQAAGEIHTDFERGFIRAEIFNYDDLMALGSEAQVKSAGKYRSEGKEYIVKDGDIILFRFNV